MKTHWIAVVVAVFLSAVAVGQSGTAGSTSTNTSTVNAGANAGANGGVQAGGNSANANANANSQTHTSLGQGQGREEHSAGTSTGAAASSSNNGNNAALASGTMMQAQLSKSLDAKKAKVGDQVEAKATEDVKSNGRVVIHKGSKLVGHVTQAQAKTKENQESRLGIVFDHAVLKDGSQVTLNAAVQALAAAPAAATTAMGNSDLGMTGGGPSGAQPAPMGGGARSGSTSVLGSAVGTVNQTAGTVTSSTTGAAGAAVNGVGGLGAGGTLNSATQGVVGLKGLSLNSGASGNAQGSVISSTTQNVKLDSGTQMVLQTGPASQ